MSQSHSELTFSTISDSLYLQQICPDLLVRAVLGVLLGQLCDPLRDLGQSLGAGDQLLLRSSARAHQIGEVREQVGDLLGGRDDLVIRVVPLHQGKEKLCLKAP